MSGPLRVSLSVRCQLDIQAQMMLSPFLPESKESLEVVPQAHSLNPGRFLVSIHRSRQTGVSLSLIWRTIPPDTTRGVPRLTSYPKPSLYVPRRRGGQVRSGVTAPSYSGSFCSILL